MADSSARYWKDMPPRLRPRLLGLLAYLPLSVWFAASGALWGWVLVLLPGAFWLLKAWLLNDVLGIGEKRAGLVSYTFEHIWNAAGYLRAVAVTFLLVLVLGGLGWLGTGELRQERSLPTVTERAVEMAKATVHTAYDLGDRAFTTGKVWIDRAKGWLD